MCHDRLGRIDEARLCLHRAKTIVEPRTGLSDADIEKLDALRAEVELLLRRHKRQ